MKRQHNFLNSIYLITYLLFFIIVINCKNENIYIIRDRAVSFCWGPDTGSFAYVVEQPESFDALNNSQHTYTEMYIHITTSIEDVLLIGKDTAGYDIAWSPKGDLMAVTSSLDNSPVSIWFFPLDRKKPPFKMSDDYYINCNPAFSPDGKKIAFISNRSVNRVVCVKSLNSDTVTILTEKLPGNSNYPFWNPNDKEIIFTSFNTETLNDIYTVNLETGVITPLIQSPVDELNACYSPDGKYIVFYKSLDRKTTAIWIKEVRTGKEYPFSYMLSFHWIGARFNPDGTKIAFLALTKKLKKYDANVNLVYQPFSIKK